MMSKSKPRHTNAPVAREAFVSVSHVSYSQVKSSQELVPKYTEEVVSLWLGPNRSETRDSVAAAAAGGAGQAQSSRPSRAP